MADEERPAYGGNDQKIYKMTKLYGRIVKQEENGSEDTKETDK